MSLCVACGLSLAGDADFCPHHLSGYAEDWAVANRIMCDFIHRKWIPPSSTITPEELVSFLGDECDTGINQIPTGEGSNIFPGNNYSH